LGRLGRLRDAGDRLLAQVHGPTRRYAGTTHIDVVNTSPERGREIVSELADKGLSISGLGYYPNPLHPDPAHREMVNGHLKRVIAAAGEMGVPVVNTFLWRGRSGARRRQLARSTQGMARHRCVRARQRGQAGEGDVVYMRGAAGAPADHDRDRGFKRALEEFPDIKVVHEVFTGWQQDQGKQQMLDFIATGIPFDGVWTSGIDNVVVDAFIESEQPLVPIVGADNAGFVGQLNNVEGLVGAAVTNPGSVGGAGVTLAVNILDGNPPDAQTVLVEPELWDNVTEEGRAKLAGAVDPSLDPEWPVSISVPGWTTYTKDDIVSCKGPGE
jgi:Periplasmic binding protein domain